MVKSFGEYIAESEISLEEFIKKLALGLVRKIRTIAVPESDEYADMKGMEFTEPIAFDLVLELKKKSHFDVQEDPHFKNLPWEQINYKNLGYSIDANSEMNRGDLYIPRITITMVVDPMQEPHLYTKLHARLIDILTHEIGHLKQASQVDRTPFSANPSNGEERNASKKSYKYFLLNDEIESMVEGMYARAKQERITLDKAFDEYLQPFLQSKYITPAEYSEVMKKWIEFAIENHPDAKFSSNVDQIVDSL